MRTWEQYETEIELRRAEHMRACKTIDSLRDQLAASEAKAERMREIVAAHSCSSPFCSSAEHILARKMARALSSTEPGK